MEGIIKIDKVYNCRMCQYFRYVRGESEKLNRYKCFYRDNIRKNGEIHIISRDAVNKGEIPGWCKLEDYKRGIK